MKSFLLRIFFSWQSHRIAEQCSINLRYFAIFVFQAFKLRFFLEQWGWDSCGGVSRASVSLGAFIRLKVASVSGSSAWGTSLVTWGCDCPTMGYWLMLRANTWLWRIDFGHGTSEWREKTGELMLAENKLHVCRYTFFCLQECRDKVLSAFVLRVFC